ncbi:MAG: TRAFAC clade GTPase domain-containing protein, partial [Planctomyces sp.]
MNSPSSPDSAPSAATGNSRTDTYDHYLKVQMLGDCGAGKTAMAAGLAVLSEKSSADRTFFPLDNDTKQQFEKWRNTLRNGTWPEKTSVNTTLRFAAVKGGDHINVELSDFPGEHFLDAMQRGCIGKEAEQFQKSVKCADVLMLLLDGEKLQRDREKVLLDLPRVALKQAVFEARANRDKPARHRIDIVVVIT